MMALYRYSKIKGNHTEYLVNMCETDGEHSRSHGLKTELIKKQAESLNIPIIQENTDSGNYELNFKKVITKMKEEDVNVGVFGDIYLMEHRFWIERVCKEMNIEPVFPLWNLDTQSLLKEFIAEGFEALTVAVNTEKLDSDWLGRKLDASFYDDIIKLDGIDACAENGEYHTFVYHGPNFKCPVQFKKGEKYRRDNHSYLTLN